MQYKRSFGSALLLILWAAALIILFLPLVRIAVDILPLILFVPVIIGVLSRM